MNPENSPWPRDVAIWPTDKTAWEMVAPGSSWETMLKKKGFEMRTQIIESWDEIELPDGYEIWDEELREEYSLYLAQKK